MNVVGNIVLVTKSLCHTLPVTFHSNGDLKGQVYRHTVYI